MRRYICDANRCTIHCGTHTPRSPRSTGLTLHILRQAALQAAVDSVDIARATQYQTAKAIERERLRLCRPGTRPTLLYFL